MARPTCSTLSDSTDQQTNPQIYMKKEDRPYQKNSVTLIKSYQGLYTQSSVKRGQNTIHTKTTHSNNQKPTIAILHISRQSDNLTQQ